VHNIFTFQEKGGTLFRQAVQYLGRKESRSRGIVKGTANLQEHQAVIDLGRRTSSRRRRRKRRCRVRQEQRLRQGQ